MADMEISVGVTDERALRQMAALEARMKKAAKESEAAFTKANAGVLGKLKQAQAQSAAEMQGVMGQYKNQMQQFGYQMGDVVTQVNAGTGAMQALSMQLPQLLGGFGALGAVLGLAAAVALPLASSLFGVGDSAEEVADKVEALENSIQAYQDAVATAATPTAELVAQFGASAGAARDLYTQLAYLAQLDAMESLRTSLDAVSQQFGVAKDAVAMINAEMALGLGDSGLVAGGLKILQDEYGITIDQARQLVDLVNATETAQGYQAQAEAARDLSGFLADVVSQGGEIPPAMLDAARETANAALAALELQAATQEAADAAANVAGQAGSIDFSGAIAGANNLAAALARASSAAAALSSHGVFIGNDGAIKTNRTGTRDPSTDWRFRGPLDPDRETLKTRRAREEAEKAREDERLAKLLAGGGSGGGGGRGRKRSGGGGGGAARKPEPSIFERAERDAVALQRQIELLGKSSEETATLKARWELLDEAKKRGITVNETMNAQIEAQAAHVGRLTGELERAEISQRLFDDAIDGIASAMSGALLEGESLRDGLANVFQGIAADILNSGIRDALMAQFGGGGGGFLSGIMGALGFRGVLGNDALSQALRNTGGFGGFRAMGGPVSPSQWHVVGENGPEIFVPQSAGSIIPNHDIRHGGRGATFNINVSGTGNAEVMAAAEQGMARALKQYDATLPNRVETIRRDHLKRYS